VSARQCPYWADGVHCLEAVYRLVGRVYHAFKDCQCGARRFPHKSKR
jgi:hypothetical protein